MGHGKDLHRTLDFSINDVMRESAKRNSTKRVSIDDAIASGCGTCLESCLTEGNVVSGAKTCRTSLVVGNLLFMLQRRFRVELVFHFSRA